MKPNVLLVILDSVRAQNTSLYGHEHDTTPSLRKFAEEATTYTQARSPGVRSLTSHTSIFTGLHVEEHGITGYSDRLGEGHTIWDDLGDKDYSTGVFSTNQFITRESFGLSDAFDTVKRGRSEQLPHPEAVDPRDFADDNGTDYTEYLAASLQSNSPIKSLANGIALKLVDYKNRLPASLTYSTDKPAEIYTDLFLDWEADQDGPWAACINYMDAHSPYLPREEHDKWGGSDFQQLQESIDDLVWEFNCGQRPPWQLRALEGLYDGAIHQIDAQIQYLIETLKNRDVLEDTLVVITSDHGEGFAEPSRVRPGNRVSGHAVGIHEVLLHVPLVVKFPGQTEERRVTDVASLTEFPTLVKNIISGNWKVGDEFVPEGPVLASKQMLTEVMQERGSQYCTNISRYSGLERAAYVQDDDQTIKYITSATDGEDGPISATVVSESAQVSYRDGSDGEKVVTEAYEDVTDAGVNVHTGGVDELNDELYEQLEYWGYV